jgi:hypothetical protein
MMSTRSIPFFTLLFCRLLEHEVGFLYGLEIDIYALIHTLRVMG